MGKIETFKNFLTGQEVNTIEVMPFVIALFGTILLTQILAKFYITYGNSLSNRKTFAGNFSLLALTTLLVISIVKSSLALSLGLVGALSIVRFRSAIKEPEELMYLFLSIAIGLGFGAGQLKITITAIVIILAYMYIAKKITSKNQTHNLYIKISQTGEEIASIQSITDVIQKHCHEADLKRMDKTQNDLQTTLLINVLSTKELQTLETELFQTFQGLKVSFIEFQGNA